MVRSRKRITRKSIRQPDQFITFTSRVFSYFEVHRAKIFVALGLVVVLSLGLWGWQQYQSNQNRLASQAYARALEVFHDGKFQTALDLLDRVDAYRSPSYQRLAILYRANSHIGLKQPKEAVPLLEDFLSRTSKNSYLRQLALSNLGFAHEMANQCEEAISAYDEAAKMAGPQKEQAFLSKARCTATLGQFSEAVKLYREYLASYPGTVRAVEISLRIQAFEQKMKGASEG